VIRESCVPMILSNKVTTLLRMLLKAFSSDFVEPAWPSAERRGLDARTNLQRGIAEGKLKMKAGRGERTNLVKRLRHGRQFFDRPLLFMKMLLTAIVNDVNNKLYA
jgi:hypothetical protein